MITLMYSLDIKVLLDREMMNETGLSRHYTHKDPSKRDCLN